MANSSLIIIDGNILCMDELSSTYEALYIKGNKIKCLGTNKEVLGSVENARPGSMDLLSIDEKSRYALEMNAGWVKKNRITRGDVIEIRDIKKIT